MKETLSGEQLLKDKYMNDAEHLIYMLGGTIAVITAVLVVNVDLEPVWVWWVLPTALIIPVIFLWNNKVL